MFRKHRVLFVLFEKGHDAGLDACIKQWLLALLERLIEILYGTKLRNEVSRCFFPDSRNTFYVVGRVTTQPFVIRDEFRCESISFDDRLLVVENGVVQTLFERINLHLLPVNELHGIHVAGRNHNF